MAAEEFRDLSPDNAARHIIGKRAARVDSSAARRTQKVASWARARRAALCAGFGSDESEAASEETDGGPGAVADNAEAGSASDETKAASEDETGGGPRAVADNGEAGFASDKIKAESENGTGGGLGASAGFGLDASASPASASASPASASAADSGYHADEQTSPVGCAETEVDALTSDEQTGSNRIT